MCVLTPLFTQDAAIATPRRNEPRSRNIAGNDASSLESRAKLGQEAKEFRNANAEEYRDWLARFCKHRFGEARPDLKARVRRARGFYIDTVANPGAQEQLGRGRGHKSRRPALEYQRRRA